MYPFKHKNGKWGYRDKQKSRFRIEPVFDAAKPFINGFAAIKIGNYWGFLKKDGTYLVEPQFTNVADFDGNIAIVEKFEMHGFVKNDGTVIEPIYNSIVTFDNFALRTTTPVKTNGEKSQIVKKGKVFFVDRLGLWGILDANCNIIKEPQYQGEVKSGSRKMWLSLNGKWGCIDSSGKVLIDFVLNDIPKFKGGLALVNINEKFGILKSDMSFLLKPEFSQIKEWGIMEAFLFVQKNDLWGIVKKRDGTFLVETTMKQFPRSDGKGNLIVKVGNKIGVLTQKGEWLYPPQYSSYRDIQMEMLKQTGSYSNQNVELTICNSQNNIILVKMKHSKFSPLYSIPQGYYITTKSGYDGYDRAEFISDDFLNACPLGRSTSPIDGQQLNYPFFCQDRGEYYHIYTLTKAAPSFLIRNEIYEINEGDRIHTYNCKIRDNKVAIDEANAIFYIARTAEYAGSYYANATCLQVYSFSGISKKVLIDIHSLYDDFVNKKLKKNYIMNQVNTLHSSKIMVVNDIKVLSNGNILLIYTVGPGKDFICILDKKDFSVINALTSTDVIKFYGWSLVDGHPQYGTPTQKYSIAKDGGFYIYSTLGQYIMKIDNEGNGEWMTNIDPNGDGIGQHFYNIAELNGKVYIGGTSTEYPYVNFENAILWEISKNGTEIRRIYLTNKKNTKCLGVFCKGEILYCQILDESD